MYIILGIDMCFNPFLERLWATNPNANRLFSYW